MHLDQQPMRDVLGPVLMSGMLMMLVHLATMEMSGFHVALRILLWMLDWVSRGLCTGNLQ